MKLPKPKCLVLTAIFGLLTTTISLVQSDGGTSIPLQRRFKPKQKTNDSSTEFSPDAFSFGLPFGLDLENELDLMYFANVTIGTSPVPQKFTVVLDTGSSDLWVCSSIPGKNSFNSGSSSTFKSTGNSFTIQYVTGQASGLVGQDTVSVGGYTIKNQIFGIATQIDDFLQRAPIDGILGMAFPSMSNTKAVPVPMNMYNQGLVPNNIFSFWFNSNLSSPLAGEAFFGGYNGKFFDPPIYFAPVTPSGFWSVNVVRYRVGDSYMMTDSNVDAIVDTGTSYLYLPNPIYSWFMSSFVGVSQGFLPCRYISSAPTLYFDILTSQGLKTFTLSGQDYIRNQNGSCYLKVERSNARYIMFGITFLARYYTIYDYGNSLVGFALAKTL